MLVRILLASFLGGTLWVLENVLTYYADVFSAVLSWIFGVVVSGLVAMVFALLFLPVLLTRAWEIWCRLPFVPLTLLGIGVICALIARHPSMLWQGVDPEFGTITVYSANPWFLLASWLLTIGSLIMMPFIGFSPTKRWF